MLKLSESLKEQKEKRILLERNRFNSKDLNEDKNYPEKKPLGKGYTLREPSDRLNN